LSVYRIFDQYIDSTIDLPELPPALNARPDLQFSLMSGSPGEGWTHVHHWPLPNGETSLSCARRADEFLLNFPGLADFRINHSGRLIACFPAPKVAEATLRHLLLDQVVPRLMAHRGRLVVHASAVRLPDGAAIAFLGDTGWGKSTLASAFHARGASLLTDDSLILERAGSDCVGIPAYRGVRLRPDSLAEVFPGAPEITMMAEYADKHRVRLPAAEAESRQVPVSGLFLLSDPVKHHGRMAVSILPAPARSAVMALVTCLFQLDMQDKERLGQAFLACGDLLRSGLPVNRLVYPRDHAVLDGVVERVSRFVQRPIARPA
jgi:hypothetical protein